MTKNIEQYLKSRLVYSSKEERICWREREGNKKGYRGRPVSLDELLFIIKEFTSLPDTSRIDQQEPDITQVQLPPKQSLH